MEDTQMQVLEPGEANYTREARRIQDKALARETRCVRLGAILFFCANGDAWMLDVENQLARCLAEAGRKLPLGIRESPTQFAVEWNARYEIAGEVFTVLESKGRGRSIAGYPTANILGLSQGS